MHPITTDPSLNDHDIDNGKPVDPGLVVSYVSVLRARRALIRLLLGSARVRHQGSVQQRREQAERYEGEYRQRDEQQ